MTSLDHSLRPFRFAGVALSSWAFGLRIWAATILALYAAFWLQLESASSAAVCVGILAIPNRGQALQKAVYRFFATVVGVLAYIMIAGFFNEVRDLFIIAFAGWLGLCVFAAGLLDGNQAYGVVLSGYTVAIVAVADVDAPQNVFANGVNRGGAITVGILAIAVVNDFLAAPDLYPELLSRISGTHSKIREMVLYVILGGTAQSTAVAQLVTEVTGLHPDITALPSKSVAGRRRASAARAAALAMVRQLSVLRAVTLTHPGLVAIDANLPADIAASLADDTGGPTLTLQTSLASVLNLHGLDHERYGAALAAGVLLSQHCSALHALRDMRTGKGLGRGPRLPLYRSRRAAGRNALRVFLSIAISSFLFVLSGWPSTSFALTLLGATAALSSTNPNPRGFAMGALIGMPIAVAAAGVTEFLILDGVDAFPLLCIAIAPTIVGACLLLRNGNKLLFGIGFIIFMFFNVIMAPSNPQSYDPQTYVYNSVLAITAAIMLFVLLSTLLPTSDAKRRKWIFDSAGLELHRALIGQPGSLDAAAAEYRDADRIGQLAALDASDARRLMDIANLASGARRVVPALNDCRRIDGGAASALRKADAALASLDARRLRSAAADLLGTDSVQTSSVIVAHQRAAAILCYFATRVDDSTDTVAQLRTGILL